MGSAAVLDLESLLRPIAGDNAAGEDLRKDLSPTHVYYQIKDVRSAARAAERQGEFEPVIGSLEASAWRPIVVTASTALTTRTKDLELAAWLIEALARTAGFAGLRDGFRLARELIERFWDGLYPSPDEDGLETRVSPLTGLNGAGGDGTLLAPISRIPITAGRGGAPLATWSCLQATELERLSEDARRERVDAGATTMEAVQTEVRETSVSFFTDLVGDIEQALVELAALGAALDKRCGADAPSTAAIRNALTTSLDMVRHVARDVLPAESTAAADAAAGTGAESGSSGNPTAAASKGVPGSIQSRDDAFRALAGVADYFRKTEPHSPIAALLDRAVRWGRLPLPELLVELIPDDSARATYQQLTGVRTPDAGS